MPQRLAQHLIARGLLKASTVDEALRRMNRSGGSLDTNLLEMTAISEAGILQAISDVSNVRLVNLADFEPNPDAAPVMPFKMAKQLGVVPLSVDGIALHVACTYPMPQNQLKDVGFLLGRKLELWVSLEVRVKNWQSLVYGQPLEARISQLLASLDPPRRSSKITAPQEVTRRVSSPNENESLSPEVLERVSRGIIDEPVLLSKPKKKSPTLPPQTAPAPSPAAAAPSLGEEDESKTSIVEAAAYSRFAKAAATAEASAGKPLGAEFDNVATLEIPRPKLPQEGADSTRMVDTEGSQRVARALTAEAPMVSEAPPAGIRFPGGVAPPRKSAPEPPTRLHHEPGSWLRPAIPSRPTLERTQGAPPPVALRPEMTPPPPPAPTVPPPVTTEPVAAPPPPEPAITLEVDEAPLLEATVVSEFTELGADEADFSDVISHSGTAAKPQEPAPTAPGPTRSVPPPPAIEPAALPMASVPSPLPQRSEPWEMTHAASLAPPPTPMSPAVPLAGVHMPPADPNISAAPPGLGPANAAEWTLAQARQSLKTASEDRDQLVSVMLDYGRRTFEFVGAFAVMRGAAYGWEARGDGDLSPIRQLAIPLDAASVFRTVAMTRGSYVGPLPPDSLSQHYLALLGRSPRTVFVWPVEVQSRLVAIIYGDCGSRPVSQRRLSDFILFCQDLPAAFHDLIVFRKLNPPAPQQYAEPELSSSEHTGELPTDADWFHGLMSLLTGPDPSERSMAMVELPEPDELGPIPGALSRLGALGATALAPLLDSNDSDTRYLALLTAGSLRYPDVVDGVMRGLFDLEPDISSAARSSAAWLRYLPEFQARMDDLRQELAASDPLRRSLAARALGVLHDREAIDGLINLTGSEDELCATSAAEALKEVTRAAFGTNTRAWTAWWAGARSKRRIEWLVEALGSDDFDLRLSAIEELSRTFGDNSGFFADGPREERDAAITQWQDVVTSRPDLEL